MIAFILVTLTLVFSLALFLTWRENNAKADMERDLEQEFLDKTR